VKLRPVLISGAFLAVALCCGIPLMIPDGGGAATRVWSGEIVEPAQVSADAKPAPAISPRTFGEGADGVDHRLAERGQGTWDYEALGILARLEAADQATSEFQETYGSAKADDDRFRGQPIETWLWEVDPQQHRDAIADELITRLGVVRKDDEEADPVMDQAIGDVSRAWVLCTRFRARLAAVETRLAKCPTGERGRLTRQQHNLQQCVTTGAQNCERIAARFTEKFPNRGK
jgi:hypothetical protein